MTTALAPFHPHTRAWFESAFAKPTDVQTRSWPVIAAGSHALITAPTGSGKTLTAFLWALDAFASGRYEPGATRVLYISPLKALNNDIQRNLLEPLGALRERFEAAGDPFPAIRVQVRSGDTSSGDRQRMLRRPPEILITTPESLMLMLTNARGRVALGTVQTVILDEIHSVVDNRRGTVLTTSLERLARVDRRVSAHRAVGHGQSAHRSCGVRRGPRSGLRAAPHRNRRGARSQTGQFQGQLPRARSCRARRRSEDVGTVDQDVQGDHRPQPLDAVLHQQPASGGTDNAEDQRLDASTARVRAPRLVVA